MLLSGLILGIANSFCLLVLKCNCMSLKTVIRKWWGRVETRKLNLGLSRGDDLCLSRTKCLIPSLNCSNVLFNTFSSNLQLNTLRSDSGLCSNQWLKNNNSKCKARWEKYLKALMASIKISCIYQDLLWVNFTTMMKMLKTLSHIKIKRPLNFSAV